MWFGTALSKMVRLKFEITLHGSVNEPTHTHTLRVRSEIFNKHIRTHILVLQGWKLELVIVNKEQKMAQLYQT